MRPIDGRSGLLASMLGLMLGLISTSHCRAGIVLSGWDLMVTEPTTTLVIGAQSVNFVGVPIGNFNFGGAIGVQNVGATDTIIRRLATAAAPNGNPAGASIPIEIVALQLVSVQPVVAFGNQTVWATLSVGPISGGTPGGPVNPVPPDKGLNIDFNAGDTGGQINSFFDVFFDLRLNSVNGPIVVANQQKTFTLLNQNWTHAPTSGALLINGVNNNLNGVDNTQDFFINGVALHDAGGGTIHATSITAVPEPSTFVLTAFVALGGIGWRRWHPFAGARSSST